MGESMRLPNWIGDLIGRPAKPEPKISPTPELHIGKLPEPDAESIVAYSFAEVQRTIPLANSEEITIKTLADEFLIAIKTKAAKIREFRPNLRIHLILRPVQVYNSMEAGTLYIFKVDALIEDIEYMRTGESISEQALKATIHIPVQEYRGIKAFTIGGDDLKFHKHRLLGVNPPRWKLVTRINTL
jgi:hypothetical protein